MKKVEYAAQQMFVDYAFKTTGKILDWNYLSPDRRLEWIKEVVNIYFTLLNDIEKDLKAFLQPANPVASYEKGFIAGQKHESHRLSEKVDYLRKSINEQYENIKERYSSEED